MTADVAARRAVLHAGSRLVLNDHHVYVDDVTGEMYDSVTTILSATNNKPWLADWGGATAATFAVDQHDLVGDTLEKAGRDAAVEMIKRAGKRTRDVKRAVGSYVHEVVKAVLLNLPGIPPIPDGLIGQDYDGDPLTEEFVLGIVDGALNFVSDFDIHDKHILMTEAMVANPDLLIAGTLDIIIELVLSRLTPVIDIKTGKNLEATWRQQLSAYRRMPIVWLPDGQRVALPETNARAVLHLRPAYDRGYKFFLDADLDLCAADYQAFLRNHESYLWQKSAKTRFGAAFYPPLADGSQPPPLVEDVPALARCRKALIAAGLRGLADVAGLTVVQLKAIHGVGPKAVQACVDALAEHGLALAETRTEEVA